MLFFFGTRAKGLDSFSIENTCDNCNQSLQRVHVFQKYFHIFWIPTIPLGKQAVMECQHCKKAVHEKEMSPTQRHLSQPKRREAKTPVYMFTGLVLFACLIAWGKHVNTQEDENTRRFIASPAANDIAVIKVSKNQYQIYKLVSVEHSLIKIQPGTYVYPSVVSAQKAIFMEKINEKEYFANTLFEITKAKYKKIKIKYVERKNLTEKL